MEIGELWNVLVVGLAIGVGFVLVDTDPIAAVCLVAYGALVAVTSFTDRFEERAGALGMLQILLLAVAVLSLYVL